jgi:multiple sugar transport system permease protein
MYWMFSNGFKNVVDITAYPPKIFFFAPTLKNYENAMFSVPFFKFLLNSCIVSLFATLGGMVLGVPAAYSIARFRQMKIAFAVLFARVIPLVSVLIPWYILFSKLGLINTHMGLIISHLLVTTPISTWLMIGFFEDIPRELEEAAWIDGSSRIKAFLLIVLPLTKPALATASILAFIFSWNNFIFSLALGGNKVNTLPVAVFNFMSFDEIDWGGVSAAASLITIPVLIFAFLIQEYFVKGLTFGGVKG